MKGNPTYTNIAFVTYLLNLNNLLDTIVVLYNLDTLAFNNVNCHFTFFAALSSCSVSIIALNRTEIHIRLIQAFSHLFGPLPHWSGGIIPSYMKTQINR